MDIIGAYPAMSLEVDTDLGSLEDETLLGAAPLLLRVAER